MGSVGSGPNGQSLMCSYVVLWPGVSMSLLRGGGKINVSNRCLRSPSGLSSSRGGNARKWSSETLPAVALDGKRVLVGRSGRVPGQRGQRARWHITASPCAAIPRMRHCGVGKFASDQEGEGWARSGPPNAERTVAQARSANSEPGHSVF